MPKIVDREKIKIEIMEAFEACIKDKPISNISLRDIAKKAGMSHPKLLSYFSAKEDIIREYCEYTKYEMVHRLELWFTEHDHREFPSQQAYLDAFMLYVVESCKNENRFPTRIQNIVLARYDQGILKNIAEEYVELRSMLERNLIKIYGEGNKAAQAEALMVLITGAVACCYNRTLTGKINSNMISSLLE